MEEQSYKKHTKLVPPFHFFLLPLCLLTFIGAAYNLYLTTAVYHKERRGAVLILMISVAMIMVSFFARVFALGAQDRAIRTEQNFRHFILVGRPMDSRLTQKQIIGLRFASDGEFPALSNKAAAENLSLDDIKKSIKTWRADHERL
jgi:hypothetical protein